MSRKHLIRTDTQYPLLMSFLGLFLVVLLAAFPPTINVDIPWRKTFVGSIFTIICALGVSAVFLPDKCLRSLSIGKKGRTDASDSAKPVLHGKSITRQGHHPTCGNYEAHVFHVKDKTVCAACNGLLLGGILALVGTVVYFFGGLRVAEHSFLIVLLGVMGVGFGLFQFKWRSLVRLAMNIIFVLGALLVLIGVNDLVGSLVFDLFIVSLICFWLYTRILLSQWDHEVICSGCEIENCGFRE